MSTRLGAIIAYLPVLIVAALTRLVGLDSPRDLVFDETYYVKDAWSLWNLGYEGKWPEGANEAFISGTTEQFSTTAAFVAHPPLGKWLIGAGIAAFGPDNPFGWRIATAVAGILTVILVMAIAYRLFDSRAYAAVAGYLVAIDGIAIVMSRTALLDQLLTVFVMAAFLAMLIDRAHTDARFRGWQRRNHPHPHAKPRRHPWGDPAVWGPVFVWRPWLLTAATLLGAATAVKWSGLYVIAVFGVWVVAADALAARRAGVTLWASGSVFRQAPVTALLLLPTALLTYLASWIGWFATSGGYNRSWAAVNGVTAAEPWASLGALWDYHRQQYAYHIAENTPHAYQANPLGWLVLNRPTAFYYETDCGATCATYITSIANPLLWWLGAAALVWVLWRMVRHRAWALSPILVGIAATYLPWLQYQHRTVFQFYTVVMEPFVVLALVAALIALSRKWQGAPAVILTIISLVSAFFLPVWLGWDIPVWFARLHYWFPAWI